MDGFWSSRCLWKRLDEMLQSIFSQNFFKIFLPPKRPTKVFWGSKHVSRKWLQRLHFSTYMKMVTSYGFCGPRGMNFPLEDGRVLLTLWVKICFPKDQFWRGTRGKNHHSLDANYSIKHNSKVLIQDILDVDMCLRIQNLKFVLQIC